MRFSCSVPPDGRGGEDSGLDLLEEALGAGTFSVREVGSAGSVPELRVVNAGERDVLVLEGDELIGLKQNRTVNSSVLVGSGTSLVLPV